MERKGPGRMAQIWCHTPLTHWMCNGYRFDRLDGEKVEGLCTCTCHWSGADGIHGASHGICMSEDPDRFEKARLTSWELHESKGLTDDAGPQDGS